VEDDPSQPDLVTQYQVAIRESLSSVREKPQGAPDRIESSAITRYVERVAKVNRIGEVSDAVRRYDNFLQKGMKLGASENTPLFDGLTVWITRGAPGSPPQILSLAKEDRPVRDAEFDIMVTRASFPPLRALLPSTPRRVADTWKIPRAATYYLFGDLPEDEGYDLNGTLKEVTKAASGTKFVAVIGISGELTLSDGPALANGEIAFAFDPTTAAAASARQPAGATAKAEGRGLPKGGKEGIVDARGWIKDVKIAWRIEFTDPEGDRRLKTTETHEIWMARRLLADIPKGAPSPAPLTLPNPPPIASPANSWLVYEDPLGRFHFRHPQVLTPQLVEPISEYEVHLANSQGGKDRMGILLQPKDASGERQLAFRDPEHFQRAMSEEWARKKLDVLRGPHGPLTGDQWNESKRKVYRVEAGLKLNRETGRDDRVFIDMYLVEFGHGQAIIVESWTDRDDHVSFRTEAEAVIKSFEFGPWKKSGGSAPTAPSAPAPPPR
jgi:hypothetical protein